MGSTAAIATNARSAAGPLPTQEWPTEHHTRVVSGWWLVVGKCSYLHTPATNHRSSGGMMYLVARAISFCYGHRLLDYDGKCRHLHGHNGKAVITLEAGELDRLGMVVDFS